MNSGSNIVKLGSILRRSRACCVSFIQTGMRNVPTSERIKPRIKIKYPQYVHRIVSKRPLTVDTTVHTFKIKSEKAYEIAKVLEALYLKGNYQKHSEMVSANKPTSKTMHTDKRS